METGLASDLKAREAGAGEEEGAMLYQERAKRRRSVECSVNERKQRDEKGVSQRVRSAKPKPSVGARVA